MEAERNRRKQLLDTQAQVNVAEGHKQRTILESEGALQAQLNEAKGRKEQTIVESQGDLEAAINEGKALSAQVEILAQALGSSSSFLLPLTLRLTLLSQAPTPPKPVKKPSQPYSK
jgi:regulator of protease activity HflC (stomatin/prohibitin superfamily)